MVMRYGEHGQDNRISTVYLAFGEVEPVRWTGERAELCGAAGLGVYGAATGTNRLGQYYCWNRTYDVNLGRWTMPDPVASPWWNLAFCSRPLQASDPTGLDEFVKSDADEVTEQYGDADGEMGTGSGLPNRKLVSASKIVVERGGVATRRVETNDGDIYRYAGTAVYWKNLKESEWSQDGNDSFSYSDGPNLLGQYCVKCTITRKYTKTKEGNYTVISWWVKNLVEGGRVPQIPKRDPDPRNKAKGGPPGGIKLPVMYHRLEAEGWAKVRFTRTITFSHEVCSWCFTDAGQTEVWNEAKKKAKENRDNGVTSSDEITTEVVEWGKKK